MMRGVGDDGVGDDDAGMMVLYIEKRATGVIVGGA